MEVLNTFSNSLTNEDFLFVQEKIFNLAGISLSEHKRELVRSRLQSFMRKSNINSIQHLRSELEGANAAVSEQFINALTTNKTDFFREPKHFDFLVENLIPQWKKSGRKEVKIWCCASSTGEEPLTLAMVLKKYLPQDIHFKILATDIDTHVLRKAQNGVYPLTQRSEIPNDFDPYIQTGRGPAQGWFKIANEIHSQITFKHHNLIEETYPGDEVFDLVFCRNVLIYFNKHTIEKLMKKIHLSIKADGYLFIGHSESLQEARHLLTTIRPSIFKKKTA